MKLTRLIVGTVAAVTLGASGAMAAPKCDPIDRSAVSSSTNALRKAPATPSKPSTPAKSAPVLVTPVARGAVWLPKLR